MQNAEYRIEENVNRMEWLLIIVATVFLLLNTFTNTRIDNDKSRMASVDSLVKRGAWVIEESRFYKTNTPVGTIIDKVYINDQFYSSKPPVMPFLMAGEYWVLYKLGLDFDDDRHIQFLVWILTFTSTGIPFLLIGVFFKWAARWFIDDPLVRLVGLFILLFCNELLGFSQTVNNHVPAGSLFFISMVLALGLVHKKIQPTPLNFFWTGLVAGLLPTVDIPAAFFCIPLWLYLVTAFPRQTLIWFTLGALPPLALHFVLTYVISGQWKPFYLVKEYYEWPGSYWGLPMAMDAAGEYENKPTNFFHLSVGRKGLFSLYPTLLLSVAYIFYVIGLKKSLVNRVTEILYLAVVPVCGWMAWAYNRDTRWIPEVSLFFYMIFAFAPFILVALMVRRMNASTETVEPVLAMESIGMGILTLIWIVFYTFKQSNYGGSATGYRWFMFFTPSFQFFGILALSRLKQGWVWGLVCVLIGIGFYSSWQATVQPWSMNYDWPIRYLGGWITRF